MARRNPPRHTRFSVEMVCQVCAGINIAFFGNNGGWVNDDGSPNPPAFFGSCRDTRTQADRDDFALFVVDGQALTHNGWRPARDGD